jgi:hypothetical protein
MSPDQLKIQELEMKVETLERQMREFLSAAELDPQIIRTITGVISGSSSKTAASATRSVNEAGASSYSVMFPPTGFISIGGFNVPYIS